MSTQHRSRSGLSRKFLQQVTSFPSPVLFALSDGIVGKRYLALQVPSIQETDCQATDHAPVLRYGQRSSVIAFSLTHDSPSIMDSSVSISFSDGIDSMDTWIYSSEKDQLSLRAVTPLGESSAHITHNDELTIRAVDQGSSPIRPPASNPPTPEPESAASTADSYQSYLTEHPAKQAFDVARAVSSHPVHAQTSSSLPLPRVSLPHEEFPVRHASPDKQVEIKHPSPRRFASLPVLLQRASGIASSLYPRSVSDSPGPPPPRSPLRLRRDCRVIEGPATSDTTRKATPKLAPSIKEVSEVRPIKPTFTTDCTGPIKRPRSHGRNSVAHPAYPSSRKEREERIRARKLRERPV